MKNERISSARREFIHQSVVIAGTLASTANVLAHGSSWVPTKDQTKSNKVNTMPKTVESFPDMLRRVLGKRLKPDITTFPDMFATNGVMQLPYAPPGIKTLLEGRPAIAEHFQRVTKLVTFDTMANVVIHETSDPDVVIIEFAGSGRGLNSGEPYEQRYISVIRMRSGHIVHYTDYWNPLSLLRTIKGEGIMKAVSLD